MKKLHRLDETGGGFFWRRVINVGKRMAVNEWIKGEEQVDGSRQVGGSA